MRSAMKAARRGPAHSTQSTKRLTKKDSVMGAPAITTATANSSPVVVRTPEPERRLLGRGVTSSADKNPSGTCVCARPKAIVFCHGCGYFRQGRKRMQCPVHSAVHFLYDIDICEKCHTSFYLDEYTL